ncbi:PH domain-containing protein [Corynebacterium phoceense]|uniref:PH domain-containing protein n=1 Tax=Corynebacterium phoceense TaxID=1686286 RepID=UPI001D366DE5|nr:PH domain-containing protein [Corynebacterium phoceense]MCQ9332641.1 PH domain-containing protein [Corynebacterium phoceense]HJG43655.1 PH domain-containing protein [Corynebacterium phoceense]
MTEQSKDAQRRTELTDEEVLEYTAADPFASTSTKPWELTLKSAYLRKIAILCVIVIMAVHIFMGVTVGLSYTGASVTTLDRFAYPGVGLIISFFVWLMLTRPRLRANSDGVEIRNLVGTRFYPWQLIYGLSFPEGSRMAHIELPNFEFVPVWALQSGDKATVIRDVQAFRDLEAVYMPED